MLPVVTKSKSRDHSTPSSRLWKYFNLMLFRQTTLLTGNFSCFFENKMNYNSNIFSFRCVGCLENNLSCFKQQRRSRPDSFSTYIYIVVWEESVLKLRVHCPPSIFFINHCMLHSSIASVHMDHCCRLRLVVGYTTNCVISDLSPLTM